MVQIQTTRCAGLLKQLEAMRFLLRQGMALRGGEEGEGNLPQLLSCWSAENADQRVGSRKESIYPMT